MKTLAFISLIFLAFGFTLNGQDAPITEVDLYGCWILELSETGRRSAKKIYVRCEESDSKLILRSSKISLLAFNKSEYEREGALCYTTYTREGTWAYDETNRTITMFSDENILKELKEKHPEEYAYFGSPKRLVSYKYRIVQLSENQMEVEKLRTTKPKRNAD